MSVLFTGGSGLLGSAVRKLRPDWFFPSHAEMEITNLDDVATVIAFSGVDVVVHAAAMTSPPKVDAAVEYAIATNIVGTGNVVSACATLDCRMVYISTDYVFRGDRGQYAPDDEIHPGNKYAWSKLGGECAVRMYDQGLIIRGSFGPVPFPYPRAFGDHFTSRIPVAEFAKRVVQIVEQDPPLFGVVHIAGQRRSVLEYAHSISPELSIGEISRSDVSFAVPRDTSLVL